MTYLHSFTKKCHLLSIPARRGLVLMLLSALFFGAAPPQTAQAQDIIRVTTTGATSGTCGDTWVSACDLQYALTTVAVSGDEIWVAQGTYKPTTGTDRAATFQLKNGVALYGGFAGWEISRDQRDWTRHETILSGDLNGDDVGFTNNGENSYHVVTGSGTDATAILDGFTVMGGNANGSSPDDLGGGMYNNNGSPTLANVIFSRNSASYYGGGMANTSSSPSLTNVTFSGNSAGGGGGMSCDDDGSPTLANVTFSGNSAGWGGGMYIRKCNLRLYNGTFSGNSASYRGGGISANAALRWRSSLGLDNVVFSGNTADDRGGGINISALKELGHVSVRLRNVTLSGNSASYRGGGMAILGEGASASLANSILWGNTAPEGSQIDLGFGNATATYSDVQGGWDGVGNINADPQFNQPPPPLTPGPMTQCRPTSPTWTGTGTPPNRFLTEMAICAS
jgi:predicted outer membrane repeat protein